MNDRKPNCEYRLAYVLRDIGAISFIGLSSLLFACGGCTSPTPADAESTAAKQTVDPTQAADSTPNPDSTPASNAGPPAESSAARQDASGAAVESKPAGITVTDDDFRMAAYEGNAQVVALALAGGANVNAMDPQQKLSALHMAAYNGHSGVVKILLQHKATVDARDHEGKTALTHACTGPFAETVELLVKAGADINAQEATEGFTPLMMAAGLGHLEVVKVLLANKADATIRDGDNDLAVDHAKNSGHTAIVELLAGE